MGVPNTCSGWDWGGVTIREFIGCGVVSLLAVCSLFFLCLFFRTSFSEFCRLYGKDERFKLVDKMKERESLFQERISELKKINKQREEEQRQSQRSRSEKVSKLTITPLSC